MKALLAAPSLFLLAGCTFSPEVPATPAQRQDPIRAEGYRGIPQATILAKGME